MASIFSLEVYQEFQEDAVVYWHIRDAHWTHHSFPLSDILLYRTTKSCLSYCSSFVLFCTFAM